MQLPTNQISKNYKTGHYQVLERMWREKTFFTARGKAHWHHHFEKCVCCTAEHTQSCDPATPVLEK